MAKENHGLINRIPTLGILRRCRGSSTLRVGTILLRIFELFLLILLILSVLWPKRDIIWEWQEKKRIEGEIVKWKEILEKYPGYRDVYLRLAVLNWQINNYEKAKENLQEAKQLDPNFEKTKEIENKILAY